MHSNEHLQAGRGNFISADSGNSDMMIRRKIRVSYKDIRANFRDVSDAQGAISSVDLFAILARYDIDMTEEQFGGRKSTSPSRYLLFTVILTSNRVYAW